MICKMDEEIKDVFCVPKETTELRILVTEADKHGTDIAKMSDFFFHLYRTTFIRIEHSCSFGYCE